MKLMLTPWSISDRGSCVGIGLGKSLFSDVEGSGQLNSVLRSFVTRLEQTFAVVIAQYLAGMKIY